MTKTLKSKDGKILATYDGNKFTVLKDAAVLMEVENFIVSNHPCPGEEVEVELVAEEPDDWEARLDDYLTSYERE